eukprot:COSAG05_NODE_17496_length_324_cov_0.915556_1_plen_82_part_01
MAAAPAGLGAAATSAIAITRWKKAGATIQAQNSVVNAFKEQATGQRPSDSSEAEWLYRDWPAWQCCAPMPSLARAKRRAQKM